MASADAKAAMKFDRLPLDVLHAHPDNDYSMDQQAMEELLDSIRRDGLAQPPIVRPIGDGYQIIAGHRRVECYRILAKEDPEAYSTIPVNILEDCSDERALVLLDVTNLMVRHLTISERAKRYERLWKTVPQLRDKQPELRGVRTSQVIADLITRETGQPISRATVDRVLAAGKRAQEVSELVETRRDELVDQWANELSTKEGFSTAAVEELASREGTVQKQIFADYQREGMTPKQLEKRLVHASPKSDADVERALDSVIKTLRDVSTWQKKYSAAVDTYRVEYIRRQLDKLVRKKK